MADIFRKKSLDKLSSPEQLDKMITINSPMTWLALAGGAFIIIIALLWGILGRVPMTEEGTGILLRDGQLHSVYAKTQGVVTKAHVSSGDTVKKGDVLFEVGSQKIAIQIKDLEERIQKVDTVTFTSSDDVVTSDNQALMDIKNQDPSLSLERDADSAWLKELNKKYNSLKAEESKLQQKLDKAKEVYAKDPTNQTAQAAVELALTEYNTAKGERKALLSEVSSAEVQLSSGKNAESVQRSALQNQFASSKAAILDGLVKQLDTYYDLADGMEIKADAEGVIYTTFITNGSNVSVDMEVVRISQPDKDGTMQAVYFMPLDSGKKVEEGMTVNIYSSAHAKEEYGHMTGTVVNVTDYVTSYADLYTRLGDSMLADTFAAGGAVVEVMCEIDRDDATASGFAWSSRKGERVVLKDGTLLGCSVVAEEVPPVTMLIPKLKEMFNMELQQQAVAEGNE